MRAAILLLVLILLPAAAEAQGLNGGIAGGLNSGFSGSINGGISSGLVGAVGALGQKPGAIRTGSELERLGFFLGSCAPGQVDINHTGCRPIRELGIDSVSTYDRSLAGTRPLADVTLQGLTLPGVTLNETTLDSAGGLSLLAGQGR